MKKVLSVVLAIMLVAMLAACGGGGSSAAASSTAPAASSTAPGSSAPAADTGAFKVALLLPGTINDHGWNAEAYDGLQLIKDELSAEVAYTEKVAASDYEEVFRGYADMGYNLIIGHGFEFGDAAKAVAPQYPDVMFAVTSSDVNQAPNLCGINNLNNQQGFLAGALSALVTKSKIVGAIGGMEIPSITAYIDGFKQGVEYIDPSIEVKTTFTGDFDDVAKCKQTAQAMIAEGADVVSHDADQAGLGVIEAVDEADGVFTVGAIADQYDLAPDVVLTSVMNKLSIAMLRAAELCQKGELQAQAYNFGVHEGTILLADFRGSVDPEIEQQVHDIYDKLVSGEITLS